MPNPQQILLTLNGLTSTASVTITDSGPTWSIGGGAGIALFSQTGGTFQIQEFSVTTTAVSVNPGANAQPASVTTSLWVANADGVLNGTSTLPAGVTGSISAAGGSTANLNSQNPGWTISWRTNDMRRAENC